MSSLQETTKRIENEVLFWLFSRKGVGFIDETYWSYKLIVEDLEIEIGYVKIAMKQLRNKKFVEFAKGLFTDDGMTAGSGHRITLLGEEYLNSLQTFKGDD